MRGKRKKIGCLSLVLVLILTGCGGVEPEKKAYPLAVSYDYYDGKYEVIYGMADLPVLTGQEKSGEGTGREESSGGEGSCFRAGSLEEIRTVYDFTQEYQLDLGHVQAVIFGKRLLSVEKQMEKVLTELEQNRELQGQVFVFAAEEPKKLMALNGSSEDSVGNYLTGLYENRETREKEPVTLSDLFYEWYNLGTLPELPEIDVAGEQIRLVQ
ncbi:MAG: hypothetical protein SOT28_08350 [Fusicatenibacter sp.]|nr:hypothetical protein [Lachnospiraceae bacterium]MDY2938300.1 hypothetical protein [Fusicatenibacter sp.]